MFKILMDKKPQKMTVDLIDVVWAASECLNDEDILNLLTTLLEITGESDPESAAQWLIDEYFEFTK